MRENFREEHFGKGREDGKNSRKSSERDHKEVWDIKKEHHQIHSLNINTVSKAAELMAGVKTK